MIMKNRDVLLSIKRKYLDMILNGEKNVELRRKVPKCDGFFRCFLVCEGKVHVMFHTFAQLLTPEQVFKNPEWKPGVSLEELKAYAGDQVYLLRLEPTATWFTNRDKIPMVVFPKPIPVTEFGVPRSPQNYGYVIEHTHEYKELYS